MIAKCSTIAIEIMAQRKLDYFRVLEIPSQAVLRVAPASWVMASEHTFRLHSVQSAVGREEPQEFDAWAIREAFLGLRTEKECLLFLNQTGRFSSDMNQTEEVTVQHINQLQATLNEYLVRPSVPIADDMELTAFPQVRSVNSNPPICSPVEFRLKESQRAVRFVAGNTTYAMLLSILLDRLKGARFLLCARPDCRRLFQVTSAHRRKFCSQYCGHFESLRRLRERNSELKRP